jgi:hypothetical protein
LNLSNTKCIPENNVTICSVEDKHTCGCQHLFVDRSKVSQSSKQ